MSKSCAPFAEQNLMVAARPAWPAWRGSGCILVIDDDGPIRTVVARSAARVGFTVDQASDGQQAIALFESNPARYTLVILDFKLPGMDGTEVVSRLRQLRPDIRVILTSGFSRQEAMEEFLGLGIAGFLQKPFALETLVSEMRAALDA
ncbi:MAG TPA: response regulator [Opitutaceae bacterium]|nr:response regulator [Opitutaceae bacterium]